MIGPAASNAVPALRRVMHGNDIAIAAFAAESLWRIDPSLKPEVNTFLPTALASTNGFARLKAARAHWRINRQPEAVLPILTNLLHDTSNPFPGDTLRALQDLGPAAAPALPEIETILADPNIGTFAAQVLKTIRSSLSSTDR